MRLNGQTIDLDPAVDGFTFGTTIGTNLPVGIHPYTLTADYGIFTLSRTGEIVVTEEGSAAPELLPQQPTLFEQVFGRGAISAETDYWTDRILAGDKKSPQELFGAMQWQRIFGGTYYDRLPGSVRAPAVATL